MWHTVVARARLRMHPGPARAELLHFRPGDRTLRRVRRRLLLSVVLLSAVAVWVGVLRSAPSVRSVRPCVEVPAGPARAGCIEEVLLTADRSGSLLESHDELLGFVAADPTLHDDCHLALHRVGLAVVDDADEVPELLARLRSPLCSWGLGHGLFEGFGALETSPTQWQALAAACTEMARTADTGALCGDGFGHALWDVLTDQHTAMLGCETLEGDQLQIACAGGVMMQQLRPADGSRAVRRDLPPDEVLARCVDQELLT